MAHALAVVAMLAAPACARAGSAADLLPIALPGFSVAPGVTAASRLHAEDAPRGLAPADDLFLYPELDAGAGFDTAPQAGHGASPFVALAPALRFMDAPLGLVGFASADLTRYRDKAADATDVSAGIGLGVPLGPSRVTLGAARIVTMDSALGLGASGGAAPFAVTVKDGRASARVPFGMFVATARIEASAATVGEAGALPPAFRARDALRESLELATDNGGLRGILLARGTEAAYRGAQPGSGFADTTGLALLAGFATDPASIWRLRLLGGAVRQDFATGGPRAGTTPVFDLAAGWTPDPLVSLVLDLSREAGLDTTLGTPGAAVATARFALALSWSRELLLTADVAARHGSIAGHGATEADLDLGALWHLSRAFAVKPTASLGIRHAVPGSAPREARLSVAVVWTP